MEDDRRPEEQESGLINRRMTRRMLLKAGAVGVAGAAAGGALVSGEARAAETAVAAPNALKFLTPWEFDYVTAMAETIWPTDDLGPGAREGGVGNYIDGQLSGSWGQGTRFYLNGPFFQPPDSGHGWQIPMTPAEVYRAFLPGFDVYCKTTYGNPYTVLPADKQTQALTDLQTGKAPIQIGGASTFTSADFFSMFRQNVLEGMLADPAYGGNRNMVGWQWIGFPGDPMRRGDVYADYIHKPDKPYPYERKPMPLQPAAAKAGVSSSPAATASKTPANAATNKLNGGM
jgi:gluconate 2-dehydrogenase gamma chain